MQSQSIRIQNVTVSALFIALLVVLGMIPGIPLGFLPVPIVIQNFGVLLVALCLGPRQGSLVMAVFVLLIALGFPVLSGGRGGAVLLVGPTAGYILAWLLLPAVYGGVLRCLPWAPSYWLRGLVLWGTSIVLTYGLGVAWLSFRTGVPFGPTLAGNGILIIGDTLKVIVAVIVAASLERLPYFSKRHA